MGVDEILIKQAIEEGIEIGTKVTVTKVENEKRSILKNAVFNMKKQGFSIEIIANILSLTESEVEAYFKELDSDVKKQN